MKQLNTIWDTCTLYSFRIDEETEDLMDCQVKVLSKADLKTNQCYVLDCTVELYLWIGEKCNKYHIEEAMECFKACMRSQVRPLWMVVGKVFEGYEPELFRLKFKDWYKRNDLHTTQYVAKSFILRTPSLLKSVKDQTASITIPKIQLVTVECYKILPDITCQKYKPGLEGYLNLNDHYVFVIVYQTEKDNEEEPDDSVNIQLYYWQSKQSSVLKWSQFLMTSGKDLKEYLQQQFHTKSHLDRIYAMEEPLLLLQALKFNIKYQFPSLNQKLFKCFVESSTKLVKLTQIPCQSDLLCSRYCYILIDNQLATLWTGSGVSKPEYKLALEQCNELLRYLDKGDSDSDKIVLGRTQLTYVQEKKEPDSFWASLGGKKEYGVGTDQQSNPCPVVIVFDMFKGKVEATLIDPMILLMGLPTNLLHSEKMFMIDCGISRPCFLWTGSKTSRQFRQGVLELMKIRLKELNDDKSIDLATEKKLIHIGEVIERNRSRASTGLSNKELLKSESSEKTNLEKPLDKSSDKPTVDKSEMIAQQQMQQYTMASTDGQISPYAVQRIENLRNIMNMRKKGKTGTIPIQLEEEFKESIQFKSYFINWVGTPDFLQKLL